MRRELLVLLSCISLPAIAFAHERRGGDPHALAGERFFSPLEGEPRHLVEMGRRLNKDPHHPLRIPGLGARNVLDVLAEIEVRPAPLLLADSAVVGAVKSALKIGVMGTAIKALAKKYGLKTAEDERAFDLLWGIYKRARAFEKAHKEDLEKEAREGFKYLQLAVAGTPA